MCEEKRIEDELLQKVTGGTQAEADEWLADFMKAFGILTKEEAFAIMTEEQKNIYQFLLNNENTDYIPYFDVLDKKP